MPDEENTMSIGAITGSKEERAALARKSIDFSCEACGNIGQIVKDRILSLTADSAAIE